MGGGVDGGGCRRGGADNPSVPELPETDERAETETRPPQEPEDDIPPDGGEPGPADDTPLRRRFFADLAAQWTVGKRTPTQHRSDRRRMARTARQKLADLAKGEQADDGHTTT